MLSVHHHSIQGAVNIIIYGSLGVHGSGDSLGSLVSEVPSFSLYCLVLVPCRSGMEELQTIHDEEWVPVLVGRMVLLPPRG